jgi:hypothetical protein
MAAVPSTSVSLSEGDWGGDSAWVTDMCHARGDQPFDAEHRTFFLHIINHSLLSFNVLALAGHSFLLVDHSTYYSTRLLDCVCAI